MELFFHSFKYVNALKVTILFEETSLSVPLGVSYVGYSSDHLPAMPVSPLYIYYNVHNVDKVALAFVEILRELSKI